MASLRIGYRRLYDSMGCSIANRQTISLVFPCGDDLQAEIYIGNKPKFGITIETEHEEYVIQGEQSRIGHYTYHADATQSSYPRSCFTEIICSHELEVTDDLFNAFYRDEQPAIQELLRIAESHADEFRMIADFLSGILGLRFHPQFIMKLLNENFVAFHNEKQGYNFASSPVQILESIQVNEAGIPIIEQFFPAIGKAERKVVQSSSKILSWLVRAWTERDIVSKFNALFIPIEMILEGIQGEMPEDQRLQVEKLQTLIGTYGDDDKEKEALMSLLDRLVKSQRPSLIDRFNTFAGDAKMPGWEKDIQAFKKFNRIRNGLLHGGDPNVRIHVTVGEEETLALEDLTERYVNYYLFQDTVVYQSRFLPRPQQSTQ
jgi:hypothetical protein